MVDDAGERDGVMMLLLLLTTQDRAIVQKDLHIGEWWAGMYVCRCVVDDKATCFFVLTYLCMYICMYVYCMMIFCASSSSSSSTIQVSRNGLVE